MTEETLDVFSFLKDGEKNKADDSLTIVSLDLATTQTVSARYRGLDFEILCNLKGGKSTPSRVLFTDGAPFFGVAAEAQTGTVSYPRTEDIDQPKRGRAKS